MHLSRSFVAVVTIGLTLLAGRCADRVDDVTEPVEEPADEAGDEAGEREPDDEPPPGPDVPPLLPAIDGLDETVVTISTSSGQDVRVDAKVAETSSERQRGLMEVPDLPDGSGMLFVFANQRSGGFWMYNTLVPLDIAYAGPDGEIGAILAMDPCTSTSSSDCPSYDPDIAYSAALEVPQGWFADQDVTTGDTLTWAPPVPAG